MGMISVSPDNEAIRELRDEVKKLNKTTGHSNIIMIFLSIVMVILTLVLVWNG